MKRIGLSRSVAAVAGLLAIAAAFAMLTTKSYANSAPLAGSGGSWNSSGNNTATITATGTPSGPGCVSCPAKTVTVSYNPSTGGWGVSPNDQPPNHTSDSNTATSTAKDTNSGASASTPSTSANGTKDAAGNTTGNDSKEKAAAKGMEDAMKAVLAKQTPPGDPSGIVGSFDIVITWSVACGDEGGKCTYTVTLHVDLDGSGNPTGATASG